MLLALSFFSDRTDAASTDIVVIAADVGWQQCEVIIKNKRKKKACTLTYVLLYPYLTLPCLEAD